MAIKESEQSREGLVIKIQRRRGALFLYILRVIIGSCVPDGEEKRDDSNDWAG